MIDSAFWRARAAKRILLDKIRNHPQLRGVGITRLDDGSYAIKVNLAELADLEVPDDVDGVPVIVNVVGRVEAL